MRHNPNRYVFLPWWNLTMILGLDNHRELSAREGMALLNLHFYKAVLTGLANLKHTHMKMSHPGIQHISPGLDLPNCLPVNSNISLISVPCPQSLKGPDRSRPYACRYIKQVKRFGINHLSKASLLCGGKHFTYTFILRVRFHASTGEKEWHWVCFGFPHNDLLAVICILEASQNIDLPFSSSAFFRGQEGLPWINESQDNWDLSAPCCKRLVSLWSPFPLNSMPSWWY